MDDDTLHLIQFTHVQIFLYQLFHLFRCYKLIPIMSAYGEEGKLDTIHNYTLREGERDIPIGTIPDAYSAIAIAIR